MESYLSPDGTHTVYLLPHESSDGLDNTEMVISRAIRNDEELEEHLSHYKDTHNLEHVRRLIKRGELEEITELNGNVLGIIRPSDSNESRYFFFPRKPIENDLQHKPITLSEFELRRQEADERFAEILSRRNTEKNETLEIERIKSELQEDINAARNRIKLHITTIEALETKQQQLIDHATNVQRAQQILPTLLLDLTELKKEFRDNKSSLTKSIRIQRQLTSGKYEATEDYKNRNRDYITELRQESQEIQEDITFTTQRIKQLKMIIASFNKEDHDKKIQEITRRIGSVIERKSLEEQQLVKANTEVISLERSIRARKREHAKADAYALFGFGDRPLIKENLGRGRSVTEVMQDLANDSHTKQVAVATAAVLAISAAGLPAPSRHTSLENTFKPHKIEVTSTPQSITKTQSTAFLSYTTTKDERIAKIAHIFGSTPQLISSHNDGIKQTGVIKKGTKISVEVPVSKIELETPTSVANVAKTFSLDSKTVADLNGAKSDSDKLSGEIVIAQRVIIKTDSKPDLQKVADQFDLDLDTLEKLNTNSPDNVLVLPASIKEPFNQSELEVASTLTIPDTNTTITPSTDTPNTTTPGTTRTISPEVARVNASLNNIKLGQGNDLTELTEAVKAMYEKYKPNDPDLRDDLPAGYIKLMLPSEAQGINVNFTVAQRTANIERYGSPELYATFLAQAKLHQLLVEQKYPQFEGSMARLRDANSPNHGTHNGGIMLDTSSEMTPGISQYSDGPFADSQFSKNYSKAFTKDLLIELSRISTRGVPTLHRVLSSDKDMIAQVNAAVGRRFLANVEAHKDHVHFIVNSKFKLPNWGLRSKDIPWDLEQDLRIAGQAKPIDQSVLDNEHKEYLGWLKDTMEASQQQTTTVQPTPEQPTPEQPTPDIITPDGTSVPALKADQLPEKAKNIGTSQLEKVKETGLWDIYKQIEEKTGVPAEYIFAIHYREGSNQADASIFAGEKLGSKNPDTGKVEGTSLIENGIKAAEHFKGMAKSVYGVTVIKDMSPEDLAKAFVAYNRGAMYKNAKKVTGQEINPLLSPYATNFYSSNEAMRFPSQGNLGGNLSWGEPQSTQGKPNQAVGALAMVAAAGGFDHYYEKTADKPATVEPTTNTPQTSNAIKQQANTPQTNKTAESKTNTPGIKNSTFDNNIDPAKLLAELSF